jgi:serine protease
MLAVNSALTPAKLTARLRETARAFPAVSDNTPQPPVCHTPTSTSDVQDAECICTTAVCGSGMLDIHAAVLAAQRPVALVSQSGVVGAGRSLSLDGTASSAALGRNLATYAWTTVTATGGAAPAVFSAPSAAMTSVNSPLAGTVVLRLTVTDNLGATDTADVTVNAATSGGSVDTPSAPATVPDSASGGGGMLDATLLLLLGSLTIASYRRKARTAPGRHTSIP